MEKPQIQLNCALILEKIYEATAEISATLKNCTLELRSRDSTIFAQTDVQATTDYGINQNVPEEEVTEIEVEFISSDNPFSSNLENQKKQRLRLQNTKQLHRKENRKRRLLQRKRFILSQRLLQVIRIDLLVEREKRCLLQRKGHTFAQRLLQALRMDLLVEREASSWKPVWHRKKPRIRLKNKFKNV